MKEEFNNANTKRNVKKLKGQNDKKKNFKRVRVEECRYRETKRWILLNIFKIFI